MVLLGQRLAAAVSQSWLASASQESRPSPCHRGYLRLAPKGQERLDVVAAELGSVSAVVLQRSFVRSGLQRRLPSSRRFFRLDQPEWSVGVSVVSDSMFVRDSLHSVVVARVVSLM